MKFLRPLAEEAVNPWAWFIAAAVGFLGAIGSYLMACKFY